MRRNPTAHSLQTIRARAAFLGLAFAGVGDADDPWYAPPSPDGNFRIRVSISENGRPLYRVQRGGKDLITPSGLGFELAEGIDLSNGFQQSELTSLVREAIAKCAPSQILSMCTTVIDAGMGLREGMAIPLVPQTQS